MLSFSQCFVYLTLLYFSSCSFFFSCTQLQRLRAWESRERRKAKQYRYEREKEDEKKEEMESEAWNLGKFLEDYDDTKEDEKYYHGNRYTRRRRERELEIEKDQRDRQKEKEELEALRLEVMERQVREREREASKREKKVRLLRGQRTREFKDELEEGVVYDCLCTYTCHVQ